MKNILIINFFHSSDRHVGALRTQRFARFLPTFGWRPYILTKSLRRRDFRQNTTSSENTFYAPTLPLNRPFHLENLIWIPFMFLKALYILRKYPVDVVMISCPPFYQALVGIPLKKWFGIKLAIDYRDAWGLNPYSQTLDRLHRLILRADRLLEECLLKTSDTLITSHQHMKDRYLCKFDFLRNKIDVIYNGFDAEDIHSEDGELFGQFTILHLGNFYAKQKARDPDLFLSALRTLVVEHDVSPDRLRVLFIGEQYTEVDEAITKRGLSAYVSCIDRVPHDIAMDYLNRSHMLLLIEAGDVMTTKVYEYLATGKPMLCLIKRGGELEGFIRKFSPHSYFISDASVDDIRNSIIDCYDLHQKGMCRSRTNKDFVKLFSRRAQTGRLAELLDTLTTIPFPKEGLQVIRGPEG